jgi:hypothetical protein
MSAENARRIRNQILNARVVNDSFEKQLTRNTAALIAESSFGMV